MKIIAVILAAGLGTRMKSLTPKVMHRIQGRTLIRHAVESVLELKPENIIIVVGKKSQLIRDELDGIPVQFAVQKEPKGTADALKAARGHLKGRKEPVLVTSGDTPIIRPETLKRFLTLHIRNREDVSILSFIAEGRHVYGRIIRDNRKVIAIVEDKDADKSQKTINEVNSGVYALSPEAISLVSSIGNKNMRGEFYLTDIVALSVSAGLKIGAHVISCETEMIGINTREDLYAAERNLAHRIVSYWLDNGISFIDGSTAYISKDTVIGQDTVIYPNVCIEGNSKIGCGCIIYPNTRIIDSIIEDGVIIKDSTVIEASFIGRNSAVGPFAHVRPGSLISESVKIGNFVEIKKAMIGMNTKASHLSYIGDACIGHNVNIGAGTITCNYDGVNKHNTIIGDNVFIGSDTQLVAPVHIGEGAYIGAGSTITKDVPPSALAISRIPQRVIEGWATSKSAVSRKASGKKR